MLGLGMDEADEEEDEQISVNEVPFIASRDFLLKYGKNFDLHLDDAGQVILARWTPERCPYGPGHGSPADGYVRKPDLS